MGIINSSAQASLSTTRSSFPQASSAFRHLTAHMSIVPPNT